MLFTIVDGRPYFIGADGLTYAVLINGNNVTIGEAAKAEITGKYTLREVQAKCTALDSIPEQKTRTKEPASEAPAAAGTVKASARKTKKSKE